MREVADKVGGLEREVESLKRELKADRESRVPRLSRIFYAAQSIIAFASVLLLCIHLAVTASYGDKIYSLLLTV